VYLVIASEALHRMVYRAKQINLKGLLHRSITVELLAIATFTGYFSSRFSPNIPGP
jgi:hypothetical protein